MKPLNVVLAVSAFLLLVGLLVRAHSFEVAQAGVLTRAVAKGPTLPERVDGTRAASVSASTISGRVPVAASAGGTTRLGSIRAIRLVFGWGAHGDRAVKVSWCESRLYARTVSPTNDWGLFALHRPVWDPALNPRARPYWPRGKDWSDVFDPYVNARVAWAISRRGTDFWTHWRWSAGCWA